MEELLKVMKALLPKLNDKQLKSIVAMLGYDGYSIAESADEADDNTTKSITIASLVGSLQTLGYKPALPGMEETPSTKSMRVPMHNPEAVSIMDDSDQVDDEAEVAAHNKKAIAGAYVLQYGEVNAAQKAIMGDILGADYDERLYEQEVAFAKYIRGGERRVTNAEMKLLNTQIFPIKTLLAAVMDGGLDVRTIKATQIESQGELGGIAVPPNRQSSIETRLPGLTAVRGGGANVITLVNSNATEIPQWRSDDTTDQRYIGMIRGERGNETKDPAAKNFKLDLVPLVAYLYTFKVPMSQSLVEDAANVVTMLMNDIAVTIAMDEDQEFLVGDGVGKSEGILPNSLNANSLKEVVSGDASVLKVAGIKALKRGVATQYRNRCVWVGTSGTASAIEQMTAGAGLSNWAFPDLSEDNMLLGRQFYESEVMPEVAGNAYPLIFGDMSGYDIVERLGMSIMRFQDSATGINKVEYHVRKRFGGKIEKPWKFAVQKVAAS